MTGRQRTHYELQLRRERAEAERLLAATPINADVDLSTTDCADLATIASERERDHLVNVMESTAVDEMSAALARMESSPELFGRCVSCGCEIPSARLDVLPATRYCATHAPDR